jgi:hypothetical protein
MTPTPTTRLDKLFASYTFEGDVRLEVRVRGDCLIPALQSVVSTEDVLEMLEMLIALKRKELAKSANTLQSEGRPQGMGVGPLFPKAEFLAAEADKIIDDAPPLPLKP